MREICKNCSANMEMIDKTHFVNTSKEIHWCDYCGTVLKLHITKWANIGALKTNVDTKEDWKIPQGDPYR
jgi:uncharacterized Zn finger protein